VTYRSYRISDINSFAAAGDYSRQHALSASVDQSRHVHASEIYHILHSNGLWETRHCSVLSKKLIGGKRVKIDVEFCLNDHWWFDDS